MAKAAHTMLRVLDEARWVAFYTLAFALVVRARHAFDTFTLVYLGNDETGYELALTVNHGHAAPYVIGDGYGHMAFVVQDIAAQHARFATKGLDPRPIVEFLHGGVMFARYFFVADPDGYPIEVIQRAGRFA